MEVPSSTSTVDMNAAEDQPRHRRRPGRWRLHNCCLRASLRTGCTIISIWSMNEALLFLIGASSMLYHYKDPQPCHENMDSNSTAFPTIIPLNKKNCIPVDSHNMPASQSSLFVVAVVGVLIVMSTYFLVSALMLYGIKKKRPKLLSPWLWWSIGEMIATFHTFTLLERSVSIFLKIYCCFIVYSYIEELKEENEQDDIVTYVSHRNGGAGGGGSSASHGCPALNGSAGPGVLVRGGHTSGAHYTASDGSSHHVCLPGFMTPEDVAAKVDAANAVRFYNQDPPPYSPPQPGYFATAGASGRVGGSSVSGQAAAATGEGDALVGATALDDNSMRIDITGSNSSSAARAAIPGIHGVIPSAQVVNLSDGTPQQPSASGGVSAGAGAVGGATASTSVAASHPGAAVLGHPPHMPPPSYEEAISDEATVYLPQFASQSQDHRVVGEGQRQSQQRSGEASGAQSAAAALSPRGFNGRSGRPSERE